MKNVIVYYTIIICSFMMILGCYSQKKANKNLYRIQAYYPEVLAKLCSSLYPPISSVKDSFAYVRGVINSGYVFLDSGYDTVNLTVVGENNIMSTNKPYSSFFRVDTMYIYKTIQVENTALLNKLRFEARSLVIDNAKKDKTNAILLRVSIILMVYTLIRWLLRIWYIKLP